MKQHRSVRILLGAILTIGLAVSASAALVTVSSTETWDGTNNPHLADGVTIAGSGTDADPYTYTIPDGMIITSTGRINLHSAGDYSIKFAIQGGNLQMDAGAVLNVERFGIRTTPNKTFVLDLSGTNSITGTGQVGPITDINSTPRVVTIQNVKDVNLAGIDLHVENVVANPVADRPLNITASGAVVVTGAIDNGDRQTGGNGGGDITIKANSIDVNNLDTRGMRTTGTVSGNISLYALSPVGNYNSGDGANNAATNKLTVRGTIRTDGPGDINGNVTLQAVVLQLVFGVIQTPPSATKDLQVGITRGGATDADLFVDVSNSGLAVSRTVQWGGTFTAPPGSGPSFTLDPFTRPDATQNVAYASSLVGTASDPDSDPLSFGKGPGPAWLQIAANGTLSGTPALLDAGTNTWQVSVFDGTRFDTATLTIFVVAGPRFTGNLFFDNGVQDTPYTSPVSGSLSNYAVYYGYYGSGTLTYAKVSGPTWLTVASNGNLSGTPDKTNVLNNAWVVSVTDGLFTNTTTLNIFVNGSPKFITDPILRATAYVSQGDYSVRAQTLEGTATDPQNVGVPGTLTWAKVSGPAWLIVNPDGTLAGTPTAGNIGLNLFTISAANAYPATTATLKIIVGAAPGGGPVEIVNREIWDGLANPHAADGVGLVGSGTATDPATYYVTNGMVLYGNGIIHTTDYNTYAVRRTESSALHIKFVFGGDLTMDAPNNGFVTAIRNRSELTAKRNLIFDLNGTNSIVGRGTIVGIGYRALTPGFNPYAVDWDQDTARTMTISNVVNVSLYELNLQARTMGSWTLAAAGLRPLLVQASGKVAVETIIDNADWGSGSLSGQDVSVYGNEITVSNVYTFAARNSGQTGLKAGNILLKALQPPGYLTANVNNTPANKLTAAGQMRADCVFAGGTPGSITTESVVLQFGPAAVITGTALSTNLSVGKTPPTLLLGPAAPGQIVLSWMNAAKPTDVYNNASAIATTPSYVVDWTGTITSFVLQQNSDLSNSSGWVNAPSGTSNPGTNTIGAGPLFYRLKWPQ